MKARQQTLAGLSSDVEIEGLSLRQSIDIAGNHIVQLTNIVAGKGSGNTAAVITKP
jgi:hypothetical protein